MIIGDRNLMLVQHHFHRLIHTVADRFFPSTGATPKLPCLADLLTKTGRRSGMGVEGMFGGFVFWLEGDGDEARLVVETSSRICSGFASRYVITPEGCVCAAKGIDL